MTDDDISKLYILQILPAEIRKDPAGAAYTAVEVQALQIGGDKGLRAFFSTMDEFMNRLGPMFWSDDISLATNREFAQPARHRQRRRK